MPGHTRQYEIAKGLVSRGWETHVFASDFNLSSRKFFFLKKFQFCLIQKVDGINWLWLRVYPYQINNTSENIVRIIKEINLEGITKKKFFDLG